MFNWFGSKPDPKEQQREADKALRKANREIERDRGHLEREEKTLELEIKRLAKAGKNDECKLLAKQLVQVRKQKQRTYAASGKIRSIGAQTKAMQADAKLADVMGSAAKTMQGMNKDLNPMKIASDMEAFKQANMKMEMSEELINDTLDDMLEESGDEEESNTIINKVLDEIGIDISAAVNKVPAVRDDLGEASGITDADLSKQLEKLRSQT